jgi:predicted CXXCH cytochrome family protein
VIAQVLAVLQAAVPVDPQACADCHGAIVAAFADSPMARALGPLEPGELGGLAPVVEPATGLSYAFEVTGERPRIVESLALPDREPHRLSAPLVFGIGAGVRDRSYAALLSGRLWFAPLEVLTATESVSRHAALAPGQTIAPGLRFGAAITPECLVCHTDALPSRRYPLNLDPRSGAGDAWTPRGISCGACHARAAEHASWRAASLAGEEVDGPDPIPDIAALPRPRRMSLCGACHLQGDVRIELGPVELPPPGDDLLEHRAIFVARDAGSEIGFVSHTERLVLSRCYLESAGFPGGGLACESCHDPHLPLADGRERERARAACTTCHADSAAVADHARLAGACSLAPAGRGEQGCADCHMPERPVFDVAGVTIHDHWIRRAPGPAAARAPLRFHESPAGDWRRFVWPDAPAPAHADDPGLALMALYQGGHHERARELLEKRASAAAERLPMYHHVRGVLLESAGRPAEARAAYERALALDPELGESVTNLGLVLGRLGEAQRGVELLSGFLARYPRSDGVLRNRAVLLQSLGDAAGMLRDLTRAMELAPDPVLARLLATIHRRRGDAGRAAALEEEARRLDPLGKTAK